MSKLSVSGLRKKLGDFTLSADFEVQAGERMALLGRSGSGKTTLLRIIAGLDQADEGQISLGGNDLSRVSPERREIGFVFQDSALFPTLSVLENAAFALRMRGMSASDRRVKVMPWLKKLGLAELADSSVAGLSGGERQRIAFVRATVWEPKLILMDEPFSALDMELRKTLRNELISLHQLCPVPLLLVTHDEADVQAVATARLKLQESADRAQRKWILQ